MRQLNVVTITRVRYDNESAQNHVLYRRSLLTIVTWFVVLIQFGFVLLLYNVGLATAEEVDNRER